MTCPICGKPVPATGDPAASTVPFCSARCRMIDFSRWNDGRYAIVEPLDPTQMLEAAQGEIDEQMLPDE